MQIITHRGLDPSRHGYFAESSREAFRDQLERGFGLEFDIQFTKDGEIVIIHDSSLRRVTEGKDNRKINEVPSTEILAMKPNGCHLITFASLLQLIDDKQKDGVVSAIHLKHGSQERHHLDSILSRLEDVDLDKFIIFDVKLETAKYLKEQNSGLKLAPSVAHSFDIKRFNGVVGGTLFSVEEVLANRKLFDWVWLDEWDLSDSDGSKKRLYTKEIFDKFKKMEFKIAVVSPELHNSSAGLLGGEKHSDGDNPESLETRMRKIINLKPDLYCTDYPDLALSLG